MLDSPELKLVKKINEGQIEGKKKVTFPNVTHIFIDPMKVLCFKSTMNLE